MDQNEKNDQSAFFSVLRNPGFRALWLGQICSQLAVSMLLFILALGVYQKTTSSTAVSGLFLAFGIPAIIFGMIAGAIVDYFDKRSILLLCDMLRAVLIVVFLFTSQNIFFVYALAFLNGVITQLYVPAEAPTIPRLVSPQYLVTANSLFSFTYYSSLAIGSIIAGPLLRSLGPLGVYPLVSAMFLVALTQSFQIPRELGKHSLRSAFIPSLLTIIKKISKAVTEGLIYVARSGKLSEALFLLTGTQIVLAVLGALAPAFADRMLKIDVHDASLFMIGPAVLGIIVGALWVGNYGYQFGSSRLIRWGITGVGIFLIFISLLVRLERTSFLSWFFTSNLVLPLELLLFFFLGVANSFLDVPANSILQEETRGNLRGRVYGLLTALVGGVGMLPVVISGILADTIGVGKVIFLMGACISLYGLYRFRYKKIS